MDNVIEALESLKVPLESIKQDPRNARQHPARNLKAIMDSLDAYGQRKPIVVNAKTKTIEAGNGMWEAAQALGWDEIAVAFVKDDKAVASAYGIMDNQSALLAEWDLPTLKDLLEELDDGETNMELTGFTAEEIEDLMTQFHVPAEGLTDDDEIPEKVETVCKTGDLWQLGEHRLLCGDATKQEDVERLMGGEKADMVLTGPPYGIGVNKMTLGNRKGHIYRGEEDWDKVTPNLDFILALDVPAIIWGGNFFKLPISRCWLVWDKGTGDNDYGDCELAWTNRDGVIKKYNKSWVGANAKELFEYDRYHPTQKPMGLFQWCLSFFPNANLILDPFLGSGTTLIACEKLGRKCRMMEIDEHYCDVIIQRWQNYTGKEAVKI